MRCRLLARKIQVSILQMAEISCNAGAGILRQDPSSLGVSSCRLSLAPTSDGEHEVLGCRTEMGGAQGQRAPMTSSEPQKRPESLFAALMWCWLRLPMVSGGTRCCKYMLMPPNPLGRASAMRQLMRKEYRCRAASTQQTMGPDGPRISRTFDRMFPRDFGGVGKANIGPLCISHASEAAQAHQLDQANSQSTLNLISACIEDLSPHLACLTSANYLNFDSQIHETTVPMTLGAKALHNG